MISIVVPVLDEAATIEGTLQHLSQLEGDCQILVVDGGSSDGTAEIARPYATVLGGEKGRARQMNAGARAAGGNVLLFLHADTRLSPDALLHVARALEDGAVIGGRFRVALDSPRFVFRLVEAAINLRDRLFGGFTGDQAIFIRSAVFAEMGGYQDIPIMEDLNLGLRMVKRGKVVRLPYPAVTSARRWEKHGVLRTVLLMWTLRFSYFAGASPDLLARFYANTR